MTNQQLRERAEQHAEQATSALDLIGEGDWTPQDVYCQLLRDDVRDLLAALEAAKQENERVGKALLAKATELEAAKQRAETARLACNLCGKLWPDHVEACGYIHTARERDTLRQALEEAQPWIGIAEGRRGNWCPPAIRKRVAEALSSLSAAQQEKPETT